MAVRATFNADFSGFLEAVGKAEKKLVDLNAGADKVGKTLDRLATDFSGRKLIQEALLIEKAIEQIGGTSKLTQKELERVGAKASEAVAKMKALGYEVPPGLQKIATEAGKTTTQMSSMLGTVGKLASAFGLAFSATAIIGGVIRLGRELFNTADELTKLRDKTGLSVEALQTFKAAGADAGNSLEEITRGVTQLQNRIASGDQSAIAALGKLGISLRELRSLDTEGQMIAISDAMRGMVDPAEQVAVAMDLFGRSGAEILPTLKKGFDDVKDGTGQMSAATIKALDDIGDAWGRLVMTAKAKAAEYLAGPAQAILGQVPIPPGATPEEIDFIRKARGAPAPLSPEELARLRAPQGGAVMAVPNFVEQANEALKAQGAIEKLLTSQGKLTEQTAEHKKALADASREQERLNREHLEAAQHLQKFITLEYESTEAIVRANVVTREQMANLRDGLTAEGLIPATRALERMGKVIDGTKAFGTSAPSYWEPAEKGAKKVKTAAEQMHTAFGNVSTILNNIPGQFADIANVATRTAEAILSSWGNWIQVAVAGVTGLIQIVANIGGPNEQQREARQNQANFIKQLEATATAQQKVDIAAVKGSRDYATLAIVGRDAMLAIGKSAAEAERVVKGLLDTENPKNFARAMEDVQDALDLQDEAWESLDDALGRYKFSIDELGPALQSQQLSKQAQQLFKDWELLSTAGVNLAAIGREMSDSVNDFVRNAIKFRTEVDPAMRPMLEQFAQMGLLTDANGEVIKDLEGAGVHFAKTMSQEFDRLIAKVNDLIQVIAVGLGVAIDTTGEKLGNLRVPGVPSGPTVGPNMPSPPVSLNGNGNGHSNGSRGAAAYDQHTHVYLNGREIAEQVTRVQTDDFLLRNKTRAA